MAIADRARTLIDIFKATPNGWLTRGELAKHLVRDRLNPFDVAALESLLEKGLIEARKRDMAGAIGFAWEYRLKGGDSLE